MNRRCPSTKFYFTKALSKDCTVISNFKLIKSLAICRKRFGKIKLCGRTSTHLISTLHNWPKTSCQSLWLGVINKYPLFCYIIIKYITKFLKILNEINETWFWEIRCSQLGEGSWLMCC